MAGHTVFMGWKHQPHEDISSPQVKSPHVPNKHNNKLFHGAATEVCMENKHARTLRKTLKGDV